MFSVLSVCSPLWTYSNLLTWGSPPPSAVTQPLYLLKLVSLVKAGSWPSTERPSCYFQGIGRCQIFFQCIVDIVEGRAKIKIETKN